MRDRAAWQDERNAARIKAAGDYLSKHVNPITGIPDFSGRIEDQPGYKAQLALDYMPIDTRYRQTAIGEQAARMQSQAQRDADAARQAIEKADFDRQQGNELALGKIRLQGDPLQQRIDEQKELNKQKEEEVWLQTQSTAELDAQKQIDTDKLALTQREVDYQRELLRISHELADLDHRRGAGRSFTHTSARQFGANLAGASREQRLAQAMGMGYAAQQWGVYGEGLQAQQSGVDAANTQKDAAIAQQQAMIEAQKVPAYLKAHPGIAADDKGLRAVQDEARASQDAANKAQAEADAAHVKSQQDYLNYLNDAQALQIEHAREVHNELQDVLDATAVANRRMTPLGAERDKFERDHPDVNINPQLKAEENALFAAKQQQTDAEFARQIWEREIDVAVRLGMNPMEADYDRLKLDHPDVSDSLLKKMAVLDRIGKGGELSTKYTMGETNFAALKGEITFGGAPPSWASGQGAAGFGNPFDSAAAMDSFKNARESALSVFRNPLQPGGSHTLNSVNRDNPADRTNLILSRLERILEKIENNTAELKL